MLKVILELRVHKGLKDTLELRVQLVTQVLKDLKVLKVIRELKGPKDHKELKVTQEPKVI